jgi:hypothetical protein
MGALSWLFGGNDRELAETQYAGRESASHTAAHADARKENRRRNREGNAQQRVPRSSTFGRPDRTSRDADRRGQAWEDAERQRHSGTSWWRGRS